MIHSILALHGQAFEVVYDVRDALPSAWWLPFPFLGAGLLGWLWLRRAEGEKELTFGYGLIAVGLLGGIAATAATVFPDLALRIRLGRGHYVTVEGVVAEFSPGDAGDHNEETFEVVSADSTYRYHYSPSRLDGGFMQTQPHGGPIRDGLRVRIFDVDGRIARLEVGTNR